LQKKLGTAVRFEVRDLNGLPAVVAAYDTPLEGWGERFVVRVDLDAEGAIREVHVVVATAKLTRIGAV
jgi:RNA polymerase sigma-70 factor (ECF subfamily)